MNAKDIVDTVNEPGRPLGHLFIEKTFQFTVSLPRLSPKRKKDYWQHLMSINKSGRQKDKYKAIIDVIKGKGVGVMLDEDTIRNLNDLPEKNRMYK